jgi:hypothetical protein
VPRAKGAPQLATTTPVDPAARLHSLLEQYRRIAKNDVSIINTWKQVLDVADDEATIKQLCHITSLLGSIDIAISAYGDEGLREQFDHHFQALAAAVVFPSSVGSQTPSVGVHLIDINALMALRGISSYLTMAMPAHTLPSKEEIASLRKNIQEAIERVAEADDFSDGLRKQLLHHLHAVAWALDYIRIAGPDGVDEAAERLLGWSVMNDGKSNSPASKLIKDILPIVGAVWLAFKAGPVVHAAIEGWHGTWLMLSPGQENSISHAADKP